MIEALLAALLSPQFVLICLACVALTQIIKAYLHLKWPSLKTNEEAKKVYFPTLPLVIGALAAYATRGDQSPAQAILEGIVAGLLSGFVFTLIKGLLRSMTRAARAPK